MKSRILFIIASITSVLFLFSACKTDSPTEGETNPTAAAEKVNQANQILIPKLVALSGGDTTALDVSSAAHDALRQGKPRGVSDLLPGGPYHHRVEAALDLDGQRLFAWDLPGRLIPEW